MVSKWGVWTEAGCSSLGAQLAGQLSMEFRGPWNSIDIRGIPWISMAFHWRDGENGYREAERIDIAKEKLTNCVLNYDS